MTVITPTENSGKTNYYQISYHSCTTPVRWCTRQLQDWSKLKQFVDKHDFKSLGKQVIITTLAISLLIPSLIFAFVGSIIVYCGNFKNSELSSGKLVPHPNSNIVPLSQTSHPKTMDKVVIEALPNGPLSVYKPSTAAVKTCYDLLNVDNENSVKLRADLTFDTFPKIERLVDKFTRLMWDMRKERSNETSKFEGVVVKRIDERNYQINFESMLYYYAQQLNDPISRDNLYVWATHLILANDSQNNVVDRSLEIIFKICNHNKFSACYFKLIQYCLNMDRIEDVLKILKRPYLWSDFEHRDKIADLLIHYLQNKVKSEATAQIFIKFFLRQNCPGTCFKIALELEDKKFQMSIITAILVHDFKNNLEHYKFNIADHVLEEMQNQIFKSTAQYLFRKRDFKNGVTALLEIINLEDKKHTLYQTFKNLIIPFGSTEDRQIVFVHLDILDEIQQQEIMSLSMKASFKHKETAAALATISNVPGYIHKFDMLNTCGEIGLDGDLFENEDLRDRYYDSVIRGLFQAGHTEYAFDTAVQARSLYCFLYLADCFLYHNNLANAFKIFEEFKKTLEKNETQFKFPQLNYKTETPEANVKFTWWFGGIEKSTELFCSTNREVLGRIHYMLKHVDYQFYIFDKMTQIADEIKDPNKKREMKSKIVFLNLSLNRLIAPLLDRKVLGKDVDPLNYLNILNKRVKYNSIVK